MSVRRGMRIITKTAWLLSAIFVCALSLSAVEPAVPSSVDVYWKSTRAIAVPGVTNVVILDDQIAHAELGNETIEFAGLSRGATVALAYVNGAPISIIVHVIEHPEKVIPPSLLRRQAELAHGVVGSDFQTSNSGGSSSFVLLNSFAWSQQVGDHRLDVTSQFEDNSQFGGRRVNLRTGGVAYRTPQLAVNVLDFNQSVSGASWEDRVNNYSSPSIMELRGAGVTLNRGNNEYSFFAGTTLPYYFLSLNATRDIAGFSFHRKQSDKLSLFGSTSYVNIPVNFTDGLHRRSYIMQNAGASYRIGKNFTLGGQVGLSNAGGLVRGDASYSSFRFSAYGSAMFASQTFPLNQLQSLFTGNSSVKGGLSYRTTFRLSQGFYFEHTSTSPGLIYRVQGSSDYFSPTASYNISHGETLSFAYIYSRNSGGFTSGTTTGNRYDFSLNSQLAQRVSNTAQATSGSLQDPLGISSQDQFTIRDSISIPINGQSLLLGVEHDRVRPSLIAKLNQELSLLSPQLQTEFLADPAAFIDSSNFPREIKALLAAEQPIGTSFSASGTIAIGSRLRINPNVSTTHATDGSAGNSWTQAVGYSLNYQIRPTLQFRSALNNVFLLDTLRNRAVRTMVFSAGFQKAFTTVPGTLPLLHHNRTIEGRVFRDNNINGTYNTGEPGLEGVEVRLDDGQVALTDSQGRYKFTSVTADEHTVYLSVTQFRQPVRMTTRGEVEADLIQRHIVVANFGILDFARVMGNVYNDLRFEDRRQADSTGMSGIDLLLDDGKDVRKFQTSGSGDFELDNISPGDYKLTLDSSSLPANYVAPAESFAIHVSPVSTVVQDIPTRALRSISGRVLLKMSKPKSDSVHAANTKLPQVGNAPNPGSGLDDTGQEFTFVPVVGAQISTGAVVALTDQEGKFLLRNLPAGNLNVLVQAAKPLPPGLSLPSGAVKMPAEPIQIQDATIIISNPELLPYLTRQLRNLPAESAGPVLASAEKPSQPRQPPPPEAQVPHSSLSLKSPKRVQAESLAAVSPATNLAAVPPEPSVVRLETGAKPVALPTVSPLPATVSMVQPIGKADLRDSTSHNFMIATLTRSSCESLQSLGEVALCLRQLRLNAAAGSQQ